MIVYEVTAVVDPSVGAAEFESYLIERHIPDLMATGCFVSADLLRDDLGYCIRYIASDRSSLDSYIGTHAPRLRADLLEHFPTGIELSRRVLNVLGTFPSS